MLKKIAIAAGMLVGLVLVLAGAGLLWAHVSIRQERTALPSAEDVASALTDDDGPIRLSWINTASQAMPRAGVLEAALDPSPTLPYVMSHPAFVLEWRDGRILLIDAGMTREEAAEFGKPLEAIGGAEPMQVLTPAAEGLGEARKRVSGMVFTHLHSDHVGGAPDVCAGGGEKVRAFMTEAQMERPNYTTRPGRTLLDETDCLRLERLGGLTLKPLEGFPGVRVVAAGGHTPGSQIILVAVAGDNDRRRYAFVGDIVNNVDGITYDIPKPLLYRTLVVPEDETRQQELRLWLRDLHQGHGFTLLPAHDQQQIERSGLPVFEGSK